MRHCVVCWCFSSDLTFVRGYLSSAVDALSIRGPPGDNIAIGICQGDDCVIKSRLNVCLPTRNGLPFTPPGPARRFLFVCCHAYAIPPRRYFLAVAFFLPATVFFGPRRVRSLVRVRWPRTGRLRRWRIPR